MLVNNGDGTYTMGPADVMCIFRLPTGRYHLVILEESPMPGPIQSLDSLSVIRLKSRGHHTDGAETLEGAQAHIAEYRKKLKIKDANVLSDVAIDMEDPVCVFPVRNWIRDNIPLKEAFGITQVT